MTPKVSVVVCTFNREEYLGTCLKNLYQQSASRAEYEVLIVNNNSTDDTEKLALEFIDQNKADNFKYFNEDRQGHSFSRNRGITESSGEIIAFIDDDAFVDENFVRNISSFFKSHKDVSAIGGKIIPVFESKRPKWMSKYLMPLVSALDMGSQVAPFKGRKFPIGANMSFRKQVFEKYGLFNVNLGRKGAGLEGGDEKEVFLRMKKADEKIMYAPDVVVDHIIPQRRIDLHYIKGLGVGVGTSERKRVSESGFAEVLKKVFDEAIKIAGTAALFFTYSLTGRLSAGWMLVRFRAWVIKGLITGK